jgi:predicted kinase
MNIVVISGAEATGKSTIGRNISEKLAYTYHAKDVIKERMFDTEKVSTWKYSWYEKHAKEQFFNEIETYVRKNSNLVIESNFIGEDKERLLHILSTKDVTIREIHCYTRGLVSFKRFVHRNETKKRHPGHHDRRWYLPVLTNAILSSLKIHDAHRPVSLSDKLLDVDTTDYRNIEYEKILDFVTAD